MPDPRRLFGNASEQLAADFLVQQGMHILTRQHSTPFGEIDIIAREDDEFVFVEVKARRSNAFGYPEESVTAQKLEKIAAAAHHFLQEKRQMTARYRIDVVAIEMKNGSPVITHIKGVGA